MRTNPYQYTTFCTGEGLWKISEALNTSQTFHIIDGLEPGTEYTVRLISNNWVDNSSIFEDVISTRSAGEERKAAIIVCFLLFFLFFQEKVGETN